MTLKTNTYAVVMSIKSFLHQLDVLLNGLINLIVISL